MRKFAIASIVLFLLAPFASACNPALGLAMGGYGAVQPQFAPAFQAGFVQPNLNFLAVPQTVVVNPGFGAFAGNGFASAGFAPQFGGGFGGNLAVSTGRASVAINGGGFGGFSGAGFGGFGGPRVTVREGGLRGLLFGRVARVR